MEINNNHKLRDDKLDEDEGRLISWKWIYLSIGHCLQVALRNLLVARFKISNDEHFNLEEYWEDLFWAGEKGTLSCYDDKTMVFCARNHFETCLQNVKKTLDNAEIYPN